jgi:hypothetical protein
MTNLIPTPADAITAISESKQQDAGATTDAGAISGAETLPLSRGAGRLQTAISTIAGFVHNLFTQALVATVGANRTLSARLGDNEVSLAEFYLQ